MEKLGFWDYLKAAFGRRLPVPLLGSLPANPMALGVFAVLGIANPGFWFLGAAAELAYLFGLASSARFQKLIQGERLLALQREWDGKMRGAVERLAPTGRERYRRLLGECRRILGISESLDVDSLGSFRDLRARSLNQLLGIFLRLLNSRQVIAENVHGLDRGSLEAEIVKLEQKLAGVEDPALARPLEGTLTIKKKRLENLERAGASLKVIAAELDRIEQQVELIREESAVSGKPEMLSERLDEVSAAMSETSRWMDHHAEMLQNVAGDEPGGVLADLPTLPSALERE